MQYQIIWFDFEAGLSLGDTVEVSESDRCIYGDYGFWYKTKTVIRFIYNTEAYSKNDAMELFKKHMRTYVWWDMNFGVCNNLPSVDDFNWSYPEGE